MTAPNPELTTNEDAAPTQRPTRALIERVHYRLKFGHNRHTNGKIVSLVGQVGLFLYLQCQNHGGCGDAGFIRLEQSEVQRLVEEGSAVE